MKCKKTGSGYSVGYMDLSLLLPFINLKGNFLKTSGDLTSPLMFSECPKYTELKVQQKKFFELFYTLVHKAAEWK